MIIIQLLIEYYCDTPTFRGDAPGDSDKRRISSGGFVRVLWEHAQIREGVTLWRLML
jgi:hypothetical protein